MITIRPHHLMCSAGYKGVNYNPESANNWAKIVNDLKTNPDTKIKLTLGEDSFCKECKHNRENGGSCDKVFVETLDKRVKDMLNIKDGAVYRFQELKEKLCAIMNPQKHQDICKECGWWKQGLCHDTFEKGD